MSYQKMYTLLFNAITEALQNLADGAVEQAAVRLAAAQQQAEALYLSDTEEKQGIARLVGQFPIFSAAHGGRASPGDSVPPPRKTPGSGRGAGYAPAHAPPHTRWPPPDSPSDTVRS